jgi:hypothetical protein
MYSGDAETQAVQFPLASTNGPAAVKRACGLIRRHPQKEQKFLQKVTKLTKDLSDYATPRTKREHLRYLLQELCFFFCARRRSAHRYETLGGRKPQAQKPLGLRFVPCFCFLSALSPGMNSRFNLANQLVMMNTITSSSSDIL